MPYNSPLLTDIIAITVSEQSIPLSNDSEYIEYLFDNLGDVVVNIKIKDINNIEKILKLSANASISFIQKNIVSIKVYVSSGSSSLFYCIQGYLKTLH